MEGGDDNAGPGPGNVKQESHPISIVVRDQQGVEVHFKIKTTTKFEKVFNAYCEKKAVDPSAVKFVFDGNRVAAQQTPADHDMEDGDVLDCMIEQVGGSH